MVMEGQVGWRPPTCNAHHTVLQNKLAGTVWTKIDDTKVFKILDLEDLERTFSAYQRQQVTAGLRWARLGTWARCHNYGITWFHLWSQDTSPVIISYQSRVCHIDFICFILSSTCQSLCVEVAVHGSLCLIPPLPTHLTTGTMKMDHQKNHTQKKKRQGML